MSYTQVFYGAFADIARRVRKPDCSFIRKSVIRPAKRIWSIYGIMVTFILLFNGTANGQNGHNWGNSKVRLNLNAPKMNFQVTRSEGYSKDCRSNEKFWNAIQVKSDGETVLTVGGESTRRSGNLQQFT